MVRSSSSLPPRPRHCSEATGPLAPCPLRLGETPWVESSPHTQPRPLTPPSTALAQLKLKTTGVCACIENVMCEVILQLSLYKHFMTFIIFYKTKSASCTSPYSTQQSQHSEFFIPPAPPPPPPPVIPSAQTAFDSPTAPSSSSSLPVSTMAALSRPYGSSPPAAPPPPPAGPPTHTHPLAHSLPPAPAEIVAPRKAQVPLVPMSDARSDLLAAIRRGERQRPRETCGLNVSVKSQKKSFIPIHCGGFFPFSPRSQALFFRLEVEMITDEQIIK